MADELPAEGETYKVGTLEAVRKSGAGRLLFLCIVMFAAAIVAYVLRSITYDAYVSLSALGITFGLAAIVEFRFYQVRVRLRNLENMLKSLKEKLT